MKRIHISIKLVITLAFVFARDIPAQSTMRQAGDGCVWKLHEFKELGVRLNYKECDKSHDKWLLRQDGNWIKQDRPSDNVIFGRHELIRVFSKPENQSIEEAISAQVISQIEISEWRSKARNSRDQKLARMACEPIEVKRHFTNTPGKIKLELYPKAGSYRNKIEKDLQSFPRDFGCGRYGAGQGHRYFEYHPNESKTRFLFVEFGWDDDALFEENSIEILEPSL